MSVLEHLGHRPIDFPDYDTPNPAPLARVRPAGKLVLATLVLVLLWLFTHACTRTEYVYLPSEVPAATPAPAVAPTYAYPGPYDFLGEPGVPSLHDEINQATSKALDCPVGSECRWPGLDATSALELIVRHLREAHIWAGRVNDEILVARTCGAKWEAYHQWNFNGRPIWAKARDTACAGTGCTGDGNSFRGIGVIDPALCPR